MAKHIYDLMILHNHEKIQALLADPNYLKELISLKRLEEENRLGGVASDLLIKDFSYLSELLADEDFQSDYENMQHIYVFKEEDKIPLANTNVVIASISAIRE